MDTIKKMYQNVRFLNELSNIYHFKYVKEVVDFIRSNESKCYSVFIDWQNNTDEKLEDLIQYANLPKPALKDLTQMDNIPDVDKIEDVRHYTEYKGRDEHKMNNKLFWIIVLVFVFLLCMATLLTQQKAHTSNKDITIENYHDHMAKALEIRDNLLDSIFYNNIAQDTSFVNKYYHMANDIMDSEFNGTELMFIAWAEYCRNFDLLDLECDNVESYMDDTKFMIDKFQSFTDYMASDILADNLQYWYHDENGKLTNIY